ncbi:YncE family protein [Kutzneria albida]|uniref:Uncharacterized protein n=1 Tax=Kutzneria albida DSM 43870 TaxID=1449976 RepID=W5WN31_9PSEU|nr:YncE family protein [Kutzneria albida]AHI02161.1 hypothetical protein KALB_8804 [Kutzneria albida DSM 43870]
MRVTRRVQVVLAVALLAFGATASQETSQATDVRAAVSSTSAQRAYLVGQGSELKVLDLTSGRVLATVDTNAMTTGLAVSGDGRTAYVVNGWIGTITVVDTVAARVARRIKTNAQLDSAVVRPDGQRLYVTGTISGQGYVLSVDTHTNTLAAAVQVGASPTGLAISQDGSRLYVVNNQGASITVVDTRVATPLATIPVPDLPQQVALSPDGGTAYVTHAGGSPTGNGAVTVIDNARNRVLDDVAVGVGAFGIAVSADGRQVYVSNLQDGTVTVLDAVSRTVQDSVLLRARGIATAAGDRHVYLATGSSATVLDGDTGLVGGQLDLVGLAGRPFTASTIVLGGTG